MPGGRAYDYSAPFFGGFTCLPPTTNTTRADRAGFASSRQDSINRSRQEYAGSRQSSFTRTDSLRSQGSLSRGDSLSGGQRSLSRGDSLSSRPPLTRMESLGRPGPGTVTTTSEYGIGPDGRPTHFSSTSYKSPYGNNYRTSTHY